MDSLSVREGSGISGGNGGGFTMQGLADLLGQNMQVVNLVAKEVGNLSRRMDNFDSTIGGIQKELVDMRENTEFTDKQGANVRRAISRRVYKLLGIPSVSTERSLDDRKVVQRYAMIFHRRCYEDAKRAGVLYDHYRATPKKYYDEAMSFIEAWYPKNGVQGLKDEADQNRIARETLL